MTDSSKRPIAVFDLDNTLADTAHRQRFLERRPRDWDAFFAAAPDDPPIPEGIALVLESAKECEIVYLTGRPERCRRDTLDWLAAQGLHIALRDLADLIGSRLDAEDRAAEAVFKKFAALHSV